MNTYDLLSLIFLLVILFWVVVFYTYAWCIKVWTTEKAFLIPYWDKIKSVPYIHAGEDADYYIERESDTLYIYFQGSHGITDWKNNFDFFAKPYKDMTSTWRVHRGFLRVWKSIEDIIAVEIADESIKKIIIVGYSHGGALAQFCHEFCRFHRDDVKVTTYAFGSPRIIFGHISHVVKSRFSGLFIITNGLDIVPHLPFLFLGFHHVGKKVAVGTDLHPTKAHLNYRAVLAGRTIDKDA